MNALNYLEQSLLSQDFCELWYWDIGKSPREKVANLGSYKSSRGQTKITMRARDFYLLNGVTLNFFACK